MIPLFVGPLGTASQKTEDFLHNLVNSIQLLELIERVEETKIGSEDDSLPKSIREEARKEYHFLNKVLEMSLSGSVKSPNQEFIVEIE